MPDLVDSSKLPPPGGDTQRAENYIKQLVQLLSENKLIATHTDLTKFDPSALQDHYRVDIKDYQLEVSHSKQPVTGKDTYVLLFINSPSVDDFYNAHGIIAFLVLNDDQFKRFKAIADEQIETRRKVEEEKRFAKAVKPIDELLDKISKGQLDAAKQEAPKTETVESKPEVKIEPKQETEEKVTEEKPQPIAPPPEPAGPPPTLEDVQKALEQAAKESAPAESSSQQTQTEAEPESKPQEEKKRFEEVKTAEPDHSLDIPKVETVEELPEKSQEPAAVALETKTELNPLPTTPPEELAPKAEEESQKSPIETFTLPTTPESQTPTEVPALTNPAPVEPVEQTPTPLATFPPVTQPEVLQTPDTSTQTVSSNNEQSQSNQIPEGNVLTESLPTGSKAPPPSGIDQAIDQAFHTSSNNTITTETPPIGT